MAIIKTKIIIFGAGNGAMKVIDRIECEKFPYEIIAFADNDEKRQNKTLFGKPVIAPKDITSLNYDHIIVSVQNNGFVKNIIEQLVNEYKIQIENISVKYLEENWSGRFVALRNVSQLINENDIQGSVAELGVLSRTFRKINLQSIKCIKPRLKR